MVTILSRFIVGTLGSAATLAVILLVIGVAKGIPIIQSLRSVFGLWWFFVGFGVFVTVTKMFERDFWVTTVRRGSPEDPGLANRGNRPDPAQRQMTKEQWKAKSREERKSKRHAQQTGPGDKQ